jgi:putative addiction module killer protein
VEVRPLQVDTYVSEDDGCPFDEWLNGLRDPVGRAQIDKRITRLRLGLLGEWDSVGDGVIELIFRNTGPGYRIYCGRDNEEGRELIILLCGGIKRGQQSDIVKAKKLWRDYNG